MASIKDQLDQLAEIQSKLDVLQMQEREIVEKLTPPMPAEIQEQVASVHAEFATQRAGAEANAKELKAEITKAIIAQGKSEKGLRLQCQYVAGRVTWDAKGVEGYALAHPELFAYKHEGEPSVRFVNR